MESEPPGMRNIRLTLAYDGTDFHGWQRQPEGPTIQGLLETVLATILGEQVTLWGSGRTDAGVHAANQVANFKTSCRIPCLNLAETVNHLLPASVRVKQACDVPLSFHARYHALCKTYRYRLLLAPVASPFMARFAYHYPYPLDLRLMRKAAGFLEGEHDFTSFAAAAGRSEEAEDGVAKKQGRSRGKVRTLYSSRLLWRAATSMLIYEVRGSGFLHHMVRNIVGTLIEVGRGKLKPSDIPRILNAQDRIQAGPTAPAKGLCLWKVEY
jgi:tRNA pseudouridine38-40 synthase